MRIGNKWVGSGSVREKRGRYVSDNTGCIPEEKLSCFRLLPENTGFTGAVNTGVRAVDSEYVLLLNNDTVPDPFFVEELCREIDTRPKAFSCGACILR